MLENFIANSMDRRRWSVFLLLFLLTGSAIWGHLGGRLELWKTAPSSSLRSETFHREVAEDFAISDSEAFLVVEVDNLFTPETLAAVRAVIHRVETLPRWIRWNGCTRCRC